MIADAFRLNVHRLDVFRLDAFVLDAIIQYVNMLCATGMSVVVITAYSCGPNARSPTCCLRFLCSHLARPSPFTSPFTQLNGTKEVMP